MICFKIVPVVLSLYFGAVPAMLSAGITPGAERMGLYLPSLENKRVGILTNHTALVGGVHLVDTLISSGIDVATVFAPEHGFRGDADAGEYVASYQDRRTGVDVVSVYGRNKKPAVGDVSALDVVLFDIQDVGLRFYTYLSSLHYMMETCAEAGVKLIVLDRPNPNGSYVDGPVLEDKYRSFVGMHPIPVVHGMTLGELAQMINGEGWLDGGLRCDLEIVPCGNYSRYMPYILPVNPSPNLPDMRSVYLYPSLCLLEGTVVSVGRGTPFPFKVYGHPDMKGMEFSFRPVSGPGAKEPLWEGKTCYGVDLRKYQSDQDVINAGVDLSHVINAYRNLGLGDKFFNRMFELLIGAGYVREMIMAGSDAEQIQAMWRGDVREFIKKRKPYLIYDDEN